MFFFIIPTGTSHTGTGCQHLPVAVPWCRGRVTKVAASIAFNFHYVYAVYYNDLHEL